MLLIWSTWEFRPANEQLWLITKYNFYFPRVEHFVPLISWIISFPTIPCPEIVHQNGEASWEEIKAKMHIVQLKNGYVPPR